MVGQQSSRASFAFKLIGQFLSSGEDQLMDPKPITNREFYAIFSMIVVGLMTVAFTIGPFSLW